MEPEPEPTKTKCTNGSGRGGLAGWAAEETISVAQAIGIVEPAGL